jgi:hypothetical protein
VLFVKVRDILRFSQNWTKLGPTLKLALFQGKSAGYIALFGKKMTKTMSSVIKAAWEGIPRTVGRENVLKENQMAFEATL